MMCGSFCANNIQQPALKGMKLFLYDKALKEMVGRQIPPNEPVLLLDAWDTIILGPAEEQSSAVGMCWVAGHRTDGNRHFYEWYTCSFLVYSTSTCI